MATITIHLIDEHGGAVAVLTSSTAPIPGARLTPAQALALDLIAAARHSAGRIVYWERADKALALVQSLLDPEQYGYSVAQEVRDAARRVLGINAVETAQDFDA